MSDHQNVIDNIDYVLADIQKLRSFTTLIKTFLSSPRGKKEIRNFSEEYLLDTVFSAGELNPIYARLTLDTTDINIDILQNAISGTRNVLVEKLKTAIKKKISITYESGLCAVQNEYIETNKETDSGKIRGIDLCLSLNKINAIFATARQLPIEPGQFVDINVSENKEVDLSRPINEITKEMLDKANDHLDGLFSCHFLSLLSDDIEHLDPFLCKNNYLSLRNFVIYIKAL